MTIRFGKRSKGGVVKRGHGGWTLTLGWHRPVLGHTDPETGDGWSTDGWNLRRSWRWINKQRERRAETRRLAEKYGWAYANEWRAARDQADREESS